MKGRKFKPGDLVKYIDHIIERGLCGEICVPGYAFVITEPVSGTYGAKCHVKTVFTVMSSRQEPSAEGYVVELLSPVGRCWLLADEIEVAQ